MGILLVIALAVALALVVGDAVFIFSVLRGLRQQMPSPSDTVGEDAPSTPGFGLHAEPPHPDVAKSSDSLEPISGRAARRLARGAPLNSPSCRRSHGWHGARRAA